MTTAQHPTSVLHDLLLAADRFWLAAFKALGPDAEPLLPVARHVAISTQPLRVRLLADPAADDAMPRVIYQLADSAFPVDLGATTAAFLEAGIRQLSPAAQQMLAGIQARGGVLGVLVTRDLQRVEALISEGTQVPVSLFALQATVEQVH